MHTLSRVPSSTNLSPPQISALLHLATQEAQGQREQMRELLGILDDPFFDTNKLKLAIEITKTGPEDDIQAVKTSIQSKKQEIQRRINWLEWIYNFIKYRRVVIKIMNYARAAYEMVEDHSNQKTLSEISFSDFIVMSFDDAIIGAHENDTLYKRSVDHFLKKGIRTVPKMILSAIQDPEGTDYELADYILLKHGYNLSKIDKEDQKKTLGAAIAKPAFEPGDDDFPNQATFESIDRLKKVGLKRTDLEEGGKAFKALEMMRGRAKRTIEEGKFRTEGIPFPEQVLKINLSSIGLPLISDADRKNPSIPDYTAPSLLERLRGKGIVDIQSLIGSFGDYNIDQYPYPAAIRALESFGISLSSINTADIDKIRAKAMSEK